MEWVSQAKRFEKDGFQRCLLGEKIVERENPVKFNFLLNEYDPYTSRWPMNYVNERKLYDGIEEDSLENVYIYSLNHNNSKLALDFEAGIYFTLLVKNNIELFKAVSTTTTNIENACKRKAKTKNCDAVVLWQGACELSTMY